MRGVWSRQCKCPTAERRIVAPVAHPLSEVALLFFDKLDQETSNLKYRKSSRAAVITHIEPLIGKLDVAAITISQVHDALAPIWTQINPTAALIRCHLEGIFGYARGKGWRTAPNPSVERVLGRLAADDQADRRTDTG